MFADRSRGLQIDLHRIVKPSTGFTDGSMPSGGLIFDQAGNLYGTTPLGGAGGTCTTTGGCGTVFKLSPNGSGGWTESVLYAFQGQPDGQTPLSGLIFDAVGNLYSTTQYGGTGTSCGNKGCGTVFELSPNGTGGWNEKTIYNFKAGSDGATP